jgi:hypothetical protein
MNALLPILAIGGAVPSVSSLIGLLVWVAIAVIVICAIVALIKLSGIVIPQPVWIVLGAFIGIGLILLIARFFGMLA